jgi:hypothetical protein
MIAGLVTDPNFPPRITYEAPNLFGPLGAHLTNYVYITETLSAALTSHPAAASHTPRDILRKGNTAHLSLSLSLSLGLMPHPHLGTPRWRFRPPASPPRGGRQPPSAPHCCSACAPRKGGRPGAGAPKQGQRRADPTVWSTGRTGGEQQSRYGQTAAHPLFLSLVV